MTGPTNPLQLHAAQDHIEQAADLLVAAAQKSDSPAGLGIDERINLAHSLVDLWVKSYVALLQAFIAGPGGGSGKASKPLPSEPVSVPGQNVDRHVTIDGPFTRVGLPTVAIPKSAMACQPAILPAGVTQFSIALLDYRYVGANYTGKVILTSTGGAAEEKMVTVGL